MLGLSSGFSEIIRSQCPHNDVCGGIMATARLIEEFFQVRALVTWAPKGTNSLAWVVLALGIIVAEPSPGSPAVWVH